MKALTNVVNCTYNCICAKGCDEDSRNFWKCPASRGRCEPGESTEYLKITSELQAEEEFLPYNKEEMVSLDGCPSVTGNAYDGML